MKKSDYLSSSIAPIKEISPPLRMKLLDLTLKMHLYNFYFTIIFLQNKSLDMAQGYQKRKSREKRTGKMRCRLPHQSPVSTLHPHTRLLSNHSFPPHFIRVDKGQISPFIWPLRGVSSRNWTRLRWIHKSSRGMDRFSILRLRQSICVHTYGWCSHYKCVSHI